MKICINEYIGPLTYLVNMSIKQGIFPDELKIAKVFPIFKSNDEQYITNYRPISLLNYFSKIFEKIVANRNMRPGATKGTLRRKNENSYFDVLCLITFHRSFKKKFSFLVQFLTKLWLLQCLETMYQKK